MKRKHMNILSYYTSSSIGSTQTEPEIEAAPGEIESALAEIKVAPEPQPEQKDLNLNLNLKLVHKLLRAMPPHLMRVQTNQVILFQNSTLAVFCISV